MPVAQPQDGTVLRSSSLGRVRSTGSLGWVRWVARAPLGPRAPGALRLLATFPRHRIRAAASTWYGIQTTWSFWFEGAGS